MLLKTLFSEFVLKVLFEKILHIGLLWLPLTGVMETGKYVCRRK